MNHDDHVEFVDRKKLTNELFIKSTKYLRITRNLRNIKKQYNILCHRHDFLRFYNEWNMRYNSYHD